MIIFLSSLPEVLQRLDFISGSTMLLNAIATKLHNLCVFLLMSSCLVFLSAFILRKRARYILEQKAGLPTVFWRPRFFNYYTKEEALTPENKTVQRIKMPSSTITGILPRMERMAGPYGMYGTVYGIFTRVVHVAHPTPAKIILNSCATKNPAYDHFKNFTGEGVFTADGGEWKDKRASVVHCLLRRSNGVGLEMEANRAVDSFMEQVEDVRRRKGDGGKMEFNVVPMLQQATIGLIYRYITHHDVFFKGCSTDDDCSSTKANDKIKNLAAVSSILTDETKNQEACRAAFNTHLFSSYLESVTAIRMIILAQSRSFWFLLPRILYKLFSPMYREEEEVMQPIRQFAAVTCENAMPGSPLALLRERSSHSSKESRISKPMLDEAITLLFAGQDTSAATLSWTLHLLSLHPDIQEKLADEIRNAIHNHDYSLEEKKEDMDKLPRRHSKKLTSQMTYLDAVIKESMRLYPVAPFVVRKLTHDVKIPETDTVLPKGLFACIWIYGLHRNENLWKDAGSFVPERWIDPKLKELDEGQNLGAFMPFAHGPRNCLGQTLANVVLRIMLAKIINEYKVLDNKLERNGGDASKLRKDMQAGFTVLPAGGVYLNFQKR